MRVPVEMPHVGTDMPRGKVVSWLKRVGNRVERDEAIFEVETEKAVLEAQAPASGTLVEIVTPEGEEADVGAPIAWIETDQ